MTGYASDGLEGDVLDITLHHFAQRAEIADNAGHTGFKVVQAAGDQIVGSAHNQLAINGDFTSDGLAMIPVLFRLKGAP